MTRRIEPSYVTTALDLWRKFARQNGLDLGDPDRVVFIASHLNQMMDDREAVEAEAAAAEKAVLDMALARKRARTAKPTS
jgi:hypothetical protein